MSTTRRVLLGIAAAGMVTVAPGCATVRDAVVAAVLGPAAGPDGVASVYERVPGHEYNAGPRVVSRLGLYGGSDVADCGLAVKQLWSPDPSVVVPSALSRPGVGLAALGVGGPVPALGVPTPVLAAMGLGVVPGVGVRITPLGAPMQPLAAARLPAGGMSWLLDYDSCPAYPETPR